MTYGFIGAGNMATAIIKGMIKSGMTSPKDIFVFDTNKETMGMACESLMISPSQSAVSLVQTCDVVFLAIKPNILSIVLQEIKSALLSSAPVLVSIVAGKTLAFMEDILETKTAIVRTMPNMNAMVGESMTAICCNQHVSECQKQQVVACFEAVGQTIELDENHYGIFSALCGSSPAFVYLFIDSLAKAAHKAGMNKKIATRLAAQTVLGSAKMLLASDEHPLALVDGVCSPGGTTIEGVCSLDKNAFVATVVAAMDATIDKEKRI